jgi:electron transport complex protein RnfG
MLALFAVATAALVASTFLGTRDAISEAKRAAEERALLEIVAREDHDNSMLDDRLDAAAEGPLLQLPAPRPIYRARQRGEVTAVILPAYAPDGYSGGIELLVGVERSGRVAGVRVIEHRETPGLGDAVDQRKSDWIEGFRGRSLGDPPAADWTVRKDGGAFDQFTGATITPRAVVRATRRALEYAAQNHERLFNSAAPADAAAIPGDEEAGE